MKKISYVSGKVLMSANAGPSVWQINDDDTDPIGYLTCGDILLCLGKRTPILGGTYVVCIWRGIVCEINEMWFDQEYLSEVTLSVIRKPCAAGSSKFDPLRGPAHGMGLSLAIRSFKSTINGSRDVIV